MKENSSRQIPELQLSRLGEYVTGWLGLHFPKKRWNDLERIICHAALELGFDDPLACIERLVSGQLSKEQAELLAAHLTIGETYFFREQKSFEILENRILPELIASRRGKEQRLRIWSAGCSTGEEAYSLAILLSRLIPDPRDWQITILATDINSISLSKAVRGVYSDWSFRGLPQWVRQKYFTKTPDGRYELPHAIRRMVTFSVLNLAEDSYPSLATNTNAMDIIFCRNVLMYFESKQQQQVIRSFRRSLPEGGWLVVSPCETSSAFSDCFETVMFPGAVFYKRSEAGEKPHVTAPQLPAGVAPLVSPPATKPPAPAPVPLSAPDTLRPVAPRLQPSPYDEALALYRDGNYEEAADSLSGLLARSEAGSGPHPALAKAVALMARTQANRGEIALALVWVEKAIAADKLNAELYHLRATIFQEQGQIPKAMASLKQAIYLDQTFVMGHFALGTLAHQNGKSGEAVKHLENALALLGPCPADDPLPGAEGMTAARLVEIITTTRASILQL
ncbi:MAG: chemotaxis protein CheR [Steroidobacteraceae bacterium]|nr:chemotaxis protein CheR [Deltaproteobacteria bacterium]